MQYVPPDPKYTARFTRDMLMRLAFAYAYAIKEGQNSFIFEGRTLATHYAKYLIEYLDRELPK